MKRAVLSAVASVATAVAGCATAPVDHDAQKTHVYTESKDVIWERAVGFFAENNLSIKTIEKASGIIAADHAVHGSFSPDMSANADCGASPLMTTVGGYRRPEPVCPFLARRKDECDGQHSLYNYAHAWPKLYDAADNLVHFNRFT